MKSLKNRTITVIVVLTMVTALVSGCNSSGNKDNTTAVTPTPTVSNTTAESTPAPDTDAPDTSAPDTSDSGDTTPADVEMSDIMGLDGNPIPAADVAAIDTYGTFATTNLSYLRKTTGVFYDSTNNAELFDIAAMDFTGTRIDQNSVEWVAVKSGDTFGTLTVDKAEINFFKTQVYDNDGKEVEGEFEYPIFSSTVSFTGTTTLTGYAIQFVADEYGIDAGDIYFYPDPATMGDYPLIGSSYSIGANYYTPDASFGAYGDTVAIHLGNAGKDYSGNAEVDTAFAEKAKFVKVEVTLDKCVAGYSEQLGTRSTTANIVSIKLV